MADAGPGRDTLRSIRAGATSVDLALGMLTGRNGCRTAAWLAGYMVTFTTAGLLYLGASAVETLAFLAAMTLGGLALLLGIMTQTRRAAVAAPPEPDVWIRKPVDEGLEDRLFREAQSRPRTPEPRVALVLSPMSHVARNLQDSVTAVDRNALCLSEPALAIDWLVENPDFFDVLLLDADGLGMPRTIEFLRDLLIVDPELPVIALTRHSRDLETYALRGFRQVTLADTGSLTRLALGELIEGALDRRMPLVDRKAKSQMETGTGINSAVRDGGWRPRVIPGGARKTGRAPVFDDAGNR